METGTSNNSVEGQQTPQKKRGGGARNHERKTYGLQALGDNSIDTSNSSLEDNGQQQEGLTVVITERKSYGCKHIYQQHQHHPQSTWPKVNMKEGKSVIDSGNVPVNLLPQNLPGNPSLFQKVTHVLEVPQVCPETKPLVIGGRGVGRGCGVRQHTYADMSLWGMK